MAHVTVNAPGKAIRRLRLLRGMKQAHLADLMGVAQSTVSRWERGDLALSTADLAAVRTLLQDRIDPAFDTALERLIETSTLPVHLICDRTHRLLAASPPRRSEWRLDMAALLGRSMLGFASAEILAAEEALPALGWFEGRASSLAVSTGPNGDDRVCIRSGRCLWERISLSDGSFGRLVTTLE